MKKCKVSTGLGGLSDVELSEKIAVVIAGLDGNTSFQTPYPTIPNMITLKGNYDEALVKAEHGSVYDTAHKNELRDALRSALMMLAAYVELNCQNSEAILVSSGFSIRKNPVKGVLPETPVNLSVKDGVHSGEVKVSFKKALNVLGYNVRYTSDLSTGTWTETQLISKTKLTISGLAKGSNIWVEVRSVNPNGISVWGNPALLEMVR